MSGAVRMVGRMTTEDRANQERPEAARQGVGGTWIAFLTIAFAVVGLTGLFATFAAPLPLERALAREAALDEALAAARSPDPRAALEALRPRLAESADAILLPAVVVGDDLEARVTHERVAMRARLQTEAQAEGNRLRWLICVVTLMAAAFGAAVLHAARRG
jgi:hypothetical protein